jgi:precorrin-6B methylase 2
VKSNLANVAQRERWNNVAGPKLVAFSDKLDRQLSQVGHLLLRAAAPRSGESVLDIGCGTGGMLVPLAEAAGERGTVVGIDLADPMCHVVGNYETRFGSNQWFIIAVNARNCRLVEISSARVVDNMIISPCNVVAR